MLQIHTLINHVASQLISEKLTIATAESCTGGLLAHYLTSISGSSAYFMQGIISYSNDAKIELLGVAKKTLESYGAVSEQTAHEMAVGIQTKAATDIGISTTGIAGPTGGTPEKPVGLVFVGVAAANLVQVNRYMFSGSRLENKERTCYETFNMLLDLIKKIS